MNRQCRIFTATLALISLYRRNQQFLACGCCIALPALGMRWTVWRLGLEQTCRLIRKTDTRQSRERVGQSARI